MCNHVHLLVEVTPPPVDGLTDEQLLARVRAIASQAEVARVVCRSGISAPCHLD
jgi:hypothetical protein